MTSPALADLRILDLTGGIAGPLGVLQLAEHGAEVIKVEPPGGRPDRTQPAARAYNRSRRSVTLDLDHRDGVRLFRDLCRSADVLVEAFAPGTMRRWGLDYASLREECPRLVYCSVPAWPSGTTFAERPGYEALVHARTGQHWENASFRAGPVFLHSPVASLAAAFLVPIGIMAALLSRDETGRGQHVEVSLLQGVLSLTTQNWNWTDRGQFFLAKDYPGVHQTSVYECANGEWIHVPVVVSAKPTGSEASVLGLDEDIDAFTLYSMPPEQRAAYDTKRRAAFKQHDRDELVAAFHAAGIGAEAIIAPHERFTHPQLLATGSVVQVDDPEVGPTTQVGPAVFLSETPAQVQGPQPTAGADTDAVLRALGYDDNELAALRAGGVI